MSLYNLSDNVNDSFEFQLAGKKYIMRYPLVGEIEDMQKLSEEQKEATDADNKELIEEKNKQLENFMYGFISPENKDDEDIKTALKKQNVRVLQNFNIMVKTELGQA